MAAVRGATRLEREAARAQLRRKRRDDFYKKLIGNELPGSIGRVSQACDYVKAVCKELDDAGREELARLLVGLADERNQYDSE